MHYAGTLSPLLLSTSCGGIADQSSACTSPGRVGWFGTLLAYLPFSSLPGVLPRSPLPQPVPSSLGWAFPTLLPFLPPFTIPHPVFPLTPRCRPQGSGSIWRRERLLQRLKSLLPPVPTLGRGSIWHHECLLQRLKSLPPPVLVLGCGSIWHCASLCHTG